jgi:hypothetical protein
LDLQDHKKNPTKLSSIRSLWILATPAQTLALDMNEASLYNDRGPDEKHSAKNVRIAVDCCTFWIESLLFESLAEQA